MEFAMMNRFHTNGYKEARSEALKKELKHLIDWLLTRLNNDHDELTTITMLKRKLDRAEERVKKAGYEFLIEQNKQL
jgi:hypothetical protein